MLRDSAFRRRNHGRITAARAITPRGGECPGGSLKVCSEKRRSPNRPSTRRRRERIMRIAVAVAAIVTVTLALIPAHAASLVTVPAGTKVLLRFETPVDS